MELSDTPASWPVVSSEELCGGFVFSVRRDTLADRGHGDFAREVVAHRGAVAVVAVDADDRILVVRQYRHPAQRELVELPAGLLDVEGEPPLEAAKRELLEEGHVTAETWSELIEVRPSPGVSTETIPVFLAEGVSSGRPDESFEARHEEAGMTRSWEPLSDVVTAVLAGRLTNGILVAGSLALWAKRNLVK